MIRKWLSVLILVTAATLFLSLSSCGYNQHLVSIQVVPSSATFDSVGSSILFRAIGTYQHPPATKDITNVVQWSVDSEEGLARRPVTRQF